MRPSTGEDAEISCAGHTGVGQGTSGAQGRDGIITAHTAGYATVLCVNRTCYSNIEYSGCSLCYYKVDGL